MTLELGSRFGQYEIAARLGAGGMGVVYRARDPRLGREVALKVLSETLTADAPRAARFAREARTLASLNHPNIGGIHGLESDGDVTALVLELVEGETIEDRFARGAVPIDEALAIAQQIASGVQAAHDLGIIHRDLKPANIKLCRDGTVKILDFGLAKALTDPPTDDSPTLTGGATQMGTILGTPAYMSPEQARGEVVDRQADIWSFGVILYELLTASSPFRRATTADTLASVIGAPPDLGHLPADVPPTIRRLIRRCLEKDRARRLRDIGDARLDIEEARAALSLGAPAETPAGPVPRGAGWGRVAATVALIAAAGIAGWLMARGAPAQRSGDAMWLSLPSFDRPSSTYGIRSMAISDDGSRVAFASSGRLTIRRLSQSVPVVVEVAASNPFFSPGGDWVAFFNTAGGQPGLMKVAASGGAPVLLVPTPDRPFGGTWRADGVIVYATSAGLHQVSEDGGEPRLLARPDPARKERTFAWPRFMPEGQSVLFTILTDTIAAAAVARLHLQTGEVSIVQTGGTAAQYVQGGRLVYASGHNLMAVAVDATTLRTLGEPVPLPGIEIANTTDTGAAQFAISESGTLIFLDPADATQPSWTLSWIDRHGKEEPLGLAPGRYTYPRVSPDGTRIAMDIPGTNRDIWIWHTKRASLTRLTNGPTEDLLPAWSADGSRVFFSSDRTGNFDVYSQASDGATPARLELPAPGAQMVASLTPDGTGLLLIEDFKDMGLLVLARPDRVEPLRRTEANEWLADVSPDGRWIAYESDEGGGRVDIFLRPFPDVNSRREQISSEGGRYPRWNPTRSGELFYVDLDGGMRAVSLTLSPDLTVGPATKLFNLDRPSRTVSGRTYDVSPVDGRFLIPRTATHMADPAVVPSVVLNWFNDLATHVPAARR